VDTEAGAAPVSPAGPPVGLAARARGLLLAAAVAAAAVGLAALLQPPLHAAYVGDGENYAAMALQPFAFVGEFPHRILGPLLAWALGLAGARFWLFSLGCSWLLTAAVFDYARARAARPGDAAMIALAVALTGAVQTYMVLVGYSDTLAFVLLLLAFRLRAHFAAVWGLVLANALAHEMVFFFAPWLFYQRLRAGGRWWREGLALGAVAGVYALWRAFAFAHATVPVRGSGAYGYWPWGTVALWCGLLLLWLAEFGPLLLVIAWAVRAREQGHGRFGPLLYFGGILATMAFAHDFQRFHGFLFLPLVLASLSFLARPRARGVYAVLLIATAVCYGVLHPRPPGIVPVPGGRLLEYLSDVLLRTGAYDAYARQEYARMFALAAAALWPLLLGGAAAYALLWWVGGRLRRVFAV
jgi:hypothetical protein